MIAVVSNPMSKAADWIVWRFSFGLFKARLVGRDQLLLGPYMGQVPPA